MIPVNTTSTAGPGERLEDPLLAAQEQRVGRLHEEARRAEVDAEPGRLDPPAVVHEQRRVADLVDEHHEQVQHEEDGEADPHRLRRHVEAFVGRHRRERGDAADARRAR